jgi:hypothetical protein
LAKRLLKKLAKSCLKTTKKNYVAESEAGIITSVELGGGKWASAVKEKTIRQKILQLL